jgi:hypothetical protein
MILQNLLEESNQHRLCVRCDYLVEDSLLGLQWLSLLLTLGRVGLVRRPEGKMSGITKGENRPV